MYDIDFDNKSYKVTTFDELRRRMREAEEKARQEQARPRSGTRRRPRRRREAAGVRGRRRHEIDRCGEDY